jgi:hypothetical protein
MLAAMKPALQTCLDRRRAKVGNNVCRQPATGQLGLNLVWDAPRLDEVPGASGEITFLFGEVHV